MMICYKDIVFWCFLLINWSLFNLIMCVGIVAKVSVFR